MKCASVSGLERLEIEAVEQAVMTARETWQEEKKRDIGMICTKMCNIRAVGDLLLVEVDWRDGMNELRVSRWAEKVRVPAVGLGRYAVLSGCQLNIVKGKPKQKQYPTTTNLNKTVDK